VYSNVATFGAGTGGGFTLSQYGGAFSLAGTSGGIAFVGTTYNHVDIAWRPGDFVRFILSSGGGSVFGGTPSGLTASGNFIAHSAFTHAIVLGNEVRTYVPEPSSAPLAGLGLLALSGYATRHRVKRRRQRT
jgi:hypothetical protein